MVRISTWMVIAVGGLLCGPAAAQQLQPAVAGQAAAANPTKWIQIKPVVNDAPGFMLRVDVDRPDRTYGEGETMVVSAVSEKDCYLYLLYFSGNQATCLFPNEFAKDNQVKAKKPVQIPGKDDEFVMEITPPFGKEVLLAIATLQPVAKLRDLIQGMELQNADLKDVRVRLQDQAKKNWAECRIEITTVAKKSAARTPRRFAVCVGISSYQGQGIEKLQVSHFDAERFAESLKMNCQVDEVILLTNEQATRANIEQAIFRDLPGKVAPGDTVLIFYSGHGWRVADTNGDETDGYDEVLVPVDGQFGKPETMIIDDTFARWMQKLDGCSIGLIFDNCYSGGASKALALPRHAKGWLGNEQPELGANDLIDGEMRRAKDLGQSNTMILAACKANQLAWEMPTRDQGSVLSYHLLQLLNDPPGGTQAQAADANQDGQLSFREIFGHVEESVPAYVKKTFEEEQTPVLFDNAKDSIVIRPQRLPN